MGKTHTEEGWMVFGIHGYPCSNGSWPSANIALGLYARLVSKDIEDLLALGYTCRRVRVTVEEIEG
jgi:hypothetical protein